MIRLPIMLEEKHWTQTCCHFLHDGRSCMELEETAALFGRVVSITIDKVVRDTDPLLSLSAGTRDREVLQVLHSG